LALAFLELVETLLTRERDPNLAFIGIIVLLESEVLDTGLAVLVEDTGVDKSLFLDGESIGAVPIELYEFRPHTRIVYPICEKYPFYYDLITHRFHIHTGIV